MICPQCKYALDAFDKVCPRCQGKGTQPSTPATPTPAVTPAPPATPPAPTATQTLDADSPVDTPITVSRNTALYVGAVIAFCIGYLSPWVNVGFLGIFISANGGVGLEFVFVLAAMASAGLAYYERQGGPSALGAIRLAIAAVSLVFAGGELIYFLLVLQGQSLGFGLPLMFLGAIGMFGLAYNDAPLPRKLPSALATGALLVLVLGYAGYNGNKMQKGEKTLPVLGGLQSDGSSARVSCVSSIKGLGTAFMLYKNDHSGPNNIEMAPDLSTAESIKSALTKYSWNGDKIFTCPTDGTPYRGNQTLSLRDVSNIPEDTIVFYEANDVHDGGRCVVFANGSARWLSADEWARESAKSGIR